ncbi:hypothetical protein K3G63_08130 [Hymenobacter sp. HSC-4F20]|uniref:hypothetical protein n=1 Tax=Hymenobacter sp. HSC-4F20 TaxID=2864135 RepID=UPI001C73150A|nr:hypothetical protein [Hymenobacter sp. HSC-4F20]MBX0290402.1 hypothetical protein [Hymenobacter sp. HSC-4F20]
MSLIVKVSTGVSSRKVGQGVGVWGLTFIQKPNMAGGPHLMPESRKTSEMPGKQSASNGPESKLATFPTSIAQIIKMIFFLFEGASSNLNHADQ